MVIYYDHTELQDKKGGINDYTILRNCDMCRFWFIIRTIWRGLVSTPWLLTYRPLTYVCLSFVLVVELLTGCPRGNSRRVEFKNAITESITLVVESFLYDLKIIKTNGATDWISPEVAPMNYG